MVTKVFMFCLLVFSFSFISCTKRQPAINIDDLSKDTLNDITQAKVAPEVTVNRNNLKFTYQFTDKEIKELSGDIAIIPFGMFNPIKVGTLTKGKLEVDLSDIKLTAIPDQAIADYSGHISERLRFSCLEFTDEKIDIAQSGSFVLIQDEMITADLFPVSDIRLENWLFSGGHEAPLQASYYELLYTDTGFSLTTQCDNSSKGTNEKDQHFTFDLDLKKGFNLIEYHIEETALPKDINDFVIPSKVTITNKNIDYKNIQWIISTADGC